MRRICATAAVLVLSVGVLAAGSGLAGASSKKATSTAKMHVGFVSGTGVPFFEGAVSSGKANCVGGRKVSVLFARNRGLTTLFGRTKTDSAGNFTMAMKSGMRVGGYFARVKKTGNCKFDDSSEVPWSNNDTTFSRAIAWMNRHR